MKKREGARKRNRFLSLLQGGEEGTFYSISLIAKAAHPAWWL
jgi:hypothetical protein